MYCIAVRNLLQLHFFAECSHSLSTRLLRPGKTDIPPFVSIPILEMAQRKAGRRRGNPLIGGYDSFVECEDAFSFSQNIISHSTSYIFDRFRKGMAHCGLFFQL